MADAHFGKRLWKENGGRPSSAKKMLKFAEETSKYSNEGEQQAFAVKEEVPDLWSSSLDQQNPAVLRIKKEDDPDGEPLIERGEPDGTSFPFNFVTVKIEDNDENPHSSEHQHIKKENKMEEEAPTSSEEKTSASSDTEVSAEDDDCDVHSSASGSKHEDTGEIRNHQSGERSSSCWNDAHFSITEQNADSQQVLDEKKLLVCDDCGKPFYYLYHLKRHMARHTGEKPFQCEECGKKFSLRGNLNQHMTIHKGEKPFACSFCDRRFRLSSYLQAHIVTHLGVKAFTCQHCGERFTREEALKRHVVRHTGVKPFACAICEKRFYRKSDLKYHMPVHSREHKVSSRPRNFACDECGKRFHHKSHVTRHMITHTGEKSFSCDVCDVMFKWESALRRHRRRFHNQ
ncbi:PREDICTED: zinc finger protein 226-like [Cyprinodon variegatus]|uniref:zinc finger protein 226-like n=1 Tax=Cyprinodon variegatus TaxID=28743 RepID=UPI000742C6C8|nr:PREDICTED: zinc finger protein 226-like [Cyprinodon variegatus]